MERERVNANELKTKWQINVFTMFQSKKFQGMSEIRVCDTIAIKL